MTTIELQLDESTLDHARRIAELRHSTLEALLKEIIERLATAEAMEDPILGMFSAELDLIDQVVNAAMVARERDPVRVSRGQSTP